MKAIFTIGFLIVALCTRLHAGDRPAAIPTTLVASIKEWKGASYQVRFAEMPLAEASVANKMPSSVKIVFTLFAIAIGIAICFVDPKANNAGPNWFWRGGRQDLIRSLICRPNGELRRFTKVCILMWFAVWLIILWLAL